MTDPIETRELRVFFVLAEELHFGRTAQRLGLSQARVSQTLAGLERRLGGRLFDRTSRRVTLTPRGEHLRRVSSDPYAALLRAVADTRSMDEALGGEWRLGMLTAVAGGPRLLEIVEEFRRQNPTVHVKLVELTFAAPLEPLRRDALDAIAIRLPLSAPDITVGPVLSREERVLAVARTNPLARQASVSVEVLADHAVARATKLPRDIEETTISPTTPSGRAIPRGVTVSTLTEILAAVARDEIVHPTVASVPDHYRHPDVVYIPMPDMPTSATALAWLTAHHDRRTHAFAAVASELFAANNHSRPTDGPVDR